MTDTRLRGLDLDLGVARALLDADDPDDAVPTILRRLCRFDGWCFAALWTADGQGGLRCKVARPTSTAVARFLSISLRVTLAPGVGRVGQVWQSGEAVVLNELTGDPYFHRAAAAAECGLHQGCLVPVLTSSGVIGVLELYRRERWVTGDEGTDVAREVGRLLGRAYERAAMRRAQGRDRDAVRRARFGACRLLSFESAQPCRDAAREHRLELLRDVIADLDRAAPAAVPTYIASEDSAQIPS
jgi:hypothetical protein